MGWVSWCKIMHAVAGLVSILILVSTTSTMAYAHEEFIILRPKFDMVITEIEGENYVVIDRDPSSYLDERPINWTYRGSLEGEIAKIVDRRRFMLDALIRVFEAKCLPMLKETVGLKYWATLEAVDEDPPALYIGLYKPTEEQMRAVVDMLDEEAEKVAKTWGTEKPLIKFYEAFSYMEQEHAFYEARDRFITAVKEGALNSSGYASFFYLGLPGWFQVNFVYGNITDSVNKDFAVNIVREVRSVIGYEVTLVIAFLKEPPEFRTDLLIEPIGQPTSTPCSTLHKIAMVVVPLTVITTMTTILLRQKRKALGKKRHRPRRRRGR